MKRAGFVLVTAIAATLAISGCTPTANAPSTNAPSTNAPSTDGAAPATADATANATNAEPVKLVVWGWLGGSADDINSKILSVFTNEHPNISVEYRAFPADSYETVLSTGLAGADGPDVAQLQAYGILQKHIDAGRLLEVNDQNVPGLSQFGTIVLDGARSTANGKVYGVPFAIQTADIFYNKKIFADNGLQEPKTWADFVKICDALKAKGIIPLGWNFKDTWETPLYQEIFGAAVYGSTDFQDKFLSGQAKLTDAPYVAGLKVLEDLVPYLPKDFTALNYADATTLFASGKAAMLPDGIWNVVQFRQANPDLDIGMFPAPPAAGGALDHAVTTTYVDGSFGVNVAGRHPDASLELLNWMSTKEFGNLFSSVLGQLSAVPGTEPADPLLKLALQFSQDAPNPYMCYAHLNGGTPACDQLMGENVQQILLGKETPEQAAANIQRGLDQWFKPGS